MDKDIIWCDCSYADTCQQGKRGAETRCKLLNNKEQPKMTREEAVELIAPHSINWSYAEEEIKRLVKLLN
jgi:hypothetical protein